MQPASSARLLDGFMAAMWLGAEKPHQGVSSGNQAWHPAPSVCNSTTALGLRAGCAGNRVRSFCSGEQYDSDLGLYYLRARYYNPVTGRFLSRDPEDGKAKIPASLHKYLYALGDPVNRIDPRGRASMLETGSLDALIGPPLPVLVGIAGGVYASASAAAVEAYLFALSKAVDAGIALADYLAAAKYVAPVTGVTKVFLCADLAVSIPETIDKHVADGLGGAIPDEAIDAFKEACMGLSF